MAASVIALNCGVFIKRLGVPGSVYLSAVKNAAGNRNHIFSVTVNARCQAGLSFCPSRHAPTLHPSSFRETSTLCSRTSSSTGRVATFPRSPSGAASWPAITSPAATSTIFFNHELQNSLTG